MGSHGVGGVVDRLRSQRLKVARQHNSTACDLLLLLSRYPDIRQHSLLAPHNLNHLGLVTLWRLRAVSRQWSAWVEDAMRSLPSLIVQSGQGDDSLFALSFAQMHWMALPCTHVQGRQCHAACSTRAGDIVLAGGTMKAELPGDHPLGSHIDADTSSVEVYCGGTWRRSMAMDLPVGHRRGCMLCLCDGSLLVIGGSGEDAVALATVWRLWPVGKRFATGVGGNSVGAHPSTSSAWERMAPMHTARSDFACGLLPDGRVVVAGGLGNASDRLNRHGHHHVMLRSAEVYDPVSDRWSCMPRMRYARSACRGCVDRFGRFIVSGGRGVQEGPLTLPLDCVECFVPASYPEEATPTPVDPGGGAIESGTCGVAQQQLHVGRWIEYGSLDCGSGAAEAAPPPPLRCRSVGHSMLCIAGDLIVIGPAFASSVGGGGGRSSGVGTESSGGRFGAMILMGTDHCPGKQPRWRRLRLQIPCRGRQCTALALPARGLSSYWSGMRQQSVLPALTEVEIEQAWAALTRMKAVKLCVELLTRRPETTTSGASGDAWASADSWNSSIRLTGPLVAFSNMVSEQDIESDLQASTALDLAGVRAPRGSEACAALFRAPLLSRNGLLQGLRSTGAAAGLVRWSIPRLVCLCCSDNTLRTILLV